MSNAPTLSVRAMAEMIDLPAYQTMRVLHDQKYPRREPQIFRMTYYQPALRAMRAFYSKGNDARLLDSARELIGAGLPKGARRRHNLRVLEAFSASEQAKRRLVISRSARARVAVSEASESGPAVQLRVAFDLVADELDAEGQPTQRRLIYFNTRAAAIDADIARASLELSHWALERAGRPLPLSSLELVDLTGGRVFRATRRRVRTVERMQATATMIEALWPAI